MPYILHAVFWISAFTIVFTYIIYPKLSQWIACCFPSKVLYSESCVPTVTVVIVAYNEGARICARIENLLASDYPSEKLHIIIADDGSQDNTEAIIESIGSSRVRYIRFPDRRGKPSRINAAVDAATSEICVLCDARQSFASDAIRILAKAFFDPRVGAVSGELHIASSSSAVGKGIDFYWSRERRLRESEAARHSSIGCTGAIYAIRRSLFLPIPSDTILDDVVIPLHIAASNHRVLHNSSAHAFDSQPLEPQFEIRRKRRTLAGNFQMLFRYPRWLLPWGHPLWWRIIAHKYLRILAPIFLISAVYTSVLLSSNPVYKTALIVQSVAYFLGILGMATKSNRKMLAIPSAFLFLNIVAILAFYDFLSSRASARWETTDSKKIA